MSDLDLDEADRLVRNCVSYNFGMWAADKLAHKVAPALIARVRELGAENDDLGSRLSEFLCEVTGGVLSYSTYPVSTMTQYADEYYDRRAKDDHDDYCEKVEPIEAERDEALAVIERVKALHVPFAANQFNGNGVFTGTRRECGVCEVLFPCPTIQALSSSLVVRHDEERGEG